MPGRVAAAAAGLALCGALAASTGAAPSAAEIMAKVAANQERALQMRSAFVYRQSVLVRFHRGNRKLAREELREFVVTPVSARTEKKMVHFEGRYDSGGRMVEYTRPRYTYKELDLDGELISEFADEFTNEKRSRDGIAADLFPLTAREQAKYRFKLEGRQNFRGRDAYRVTFKPVPGKQHGSGAPWAGEVLVDANEFQPIVVTTRLARGIPLLVRTLLGTDVKHLGFKITYDRFEEGLWFPVSYGGEFELRAVFFYKRLISLSLANTGFQRAEVSSQVSYGPPAPGEP